MGKSADIKRERLFNELAADGRLDKPLYAKKFKKVQAMPTPLVVKKQKHVCCLIKYEGKLPLGFYPCHGCTLDTGNAS